MRALQRPSLSGEVKPGMPLPVTGGGEPPPVQRASGVPLETSEPRGQPRWWAAQKPGASGGTVLTTVPEQGRQEQAQMPPCRPRDGRQGQGPAPRHLTGAHARKMLCAETPRPWASLAHAAGNAFKAVNRHQNEEMLCHWIPINLKNGLGGTAAKP